MKWFSALALCSGGLTLGAACVELGGQGYPDAAVTSSAADAAPTGGGGGDSDAAGGDTPDAGGDGDERADAGGLDAGPEAVGDHLLITEVMAARMSDASDQNAEFVEIYNPTASRVELADYYLADTHNYATLPAGADRGLNSDFIARFPDGAAIEPGAVLVVAVDGTGFELAHGAAADYSMRAHGDEPAMVGVDVGSHEALLTDNGEMIALFRWDGASDLVVDVDLVIAGTVDSASDQNALLDKTGLAVDGPDAGEETSTYADDQLRVFELEVPSDDDVSVKRIALEDGQEIREGSGNGVGGDDETSEDFLVTWHKNRDEYTAPTPGAVPEALRGAE